ncbi:MAG: Hint domain-containing protein [Albidovulum sp.]|jgi:hypothetical protein|uniref:Hint domain-containing protein n=1 Tax=Albidovulum sp. TaxID=1872424 RepID=UPI003024CC5E
MPTTYPEQFFAMDPSAPPGAGTPLTVQQFNLVDWQNNNVINTNGNNGDRIDNSDIRQMYPGDTISVIMKGQTVTITGVTFYLADGRVLFTPTDGTRLFDATFQNSTFVNTQGGLPVGTFGPPCFTPGTRIRTPAGDAPVETLVPGDLVDTFDRGPRPLRWTGRQTVDGTGGFAPVRIAKGALGNRRALVVSPQHRMLVTGWQAELLFGEPEVLVAAVHLVGRPGIERAPVTEVDYCHLLFDDHELIFAEGAPTESFHPGSILLEEDRALYAEIVSIFPELAARDVKDVPAARPVVAGREARALGG